MERRVFLRRSLLMVTGGVVIPNLLPLQGATTAFPDKKRTIHIVKRGDTLSEIAARYGSSVSAIKRNNGLRSDKIIIGDKLYIPKKSKWTYINDVVDTTMKLRLKNNRWRYIVVHHSGVDKGNAASYHKYHLSRGMRNGLAYHFVIGNGIDSGDGKVEIGNRWKKQLHGGHVKNGRVNSSGIGICLVGNFEKHRPHKKQLAALNELISYLKVDLISNKVRVAVHKEIDGAKHTVCPGRYFPTKDLHSRFG